MDLKRLDYFVRVCEAGSFTRTAAEVGLSQPSLSRQIGLLELELGQRLLERTGRGAVPTEAGQTLLPTARAMLELAQQAKDELGELQANPAGRINIGLPPRLARSLTLPLVQFFRAEFPRVALSVQEGLTIHLREWLIGGRLDAALLFDPQASPQLTFEVLEREPLFLVAAQDGAPIPSKVRARALPDYPLILPPEPNALRVLLDTVMKPYGMLLRPIVEIGSAQTLMTLVKRGIGHTVLPQGALAAYAEDGDIQAARIGPSPISSCIVLATPVARPSTRVSRAAIQVISELMRMRHADTPPVLGGRKSDKGGGQPVRP
jgi:LysR family nitrogen assimilation transcriptional regulator